MKNPKEKSAKKCVLFFLYIVLSITAIPSYNYIVYSQSPVHGVFIKPETVVKNNITDINFYASFNFKELGVKVVEISEQTYKNAKSGEYYNFSRLYVDKGWKQQTLFMASITSILFSIYFLFFGLLNLSLNADRKVIQK